MPNHNNPSWGKKYHTDDLDILEIAARLKPEYIAGFFDGEGSVVAHKAKHAPMWSARITLTQKDPKILAAIAMKYCDGVIVCTKYGGGKYKNHLCNCLQWQGRFALPFLESIEPHVIVKRAQVVAAIEMAKLTSQRTAIGGGDRKWTEEERARREELAEIIKRGNGRSWNSTKPLSEAELAEMEL